MGEIAFQLDRRILAHVFPGVTRLYGFTVSNIPEKIKQVRPLPIPGAPSLPCCRGAHAAAAWPAGGACGACTLGCAALVPRAALLATSALAWGGSGGSWGHGALGCPAGVGSALARFPVHAASRGDPVAVGGGGAAAHPHPPGVLRPQTSIKSLDGSVDEKKRRELTQRYGALMTRLERLGYSREVHPAFSEFLVNTYGILQQRPDPRAGALHGSPAALRKLAIEVVPPKFLGDALLLLSCLCELSKDDGRPLFAW